MAGVGAGGGVTEIDGESSAILYGSDEAAAAAHGEALVPFVWEQEFELDMLADDADDFDVRF